MNKRALGLLLIAAFTGFYSSGAEPHRPKILGIAHIAVYCADLAKTRAFYKEFLGFAEPFALKNEEGSADRIAFIKINDYQYVELFNEKPRAGERLNHISFYTDDAHAMRNYLVAQGVKAPEKIGKGKTGNFNYNITDPDGHTVEIVQYEPDSWTTRDKGKYMPETRISDHIMHVGVLVGSPGAANHFYHNILRFQEFWRGASAESLSWINMRVPDGQDYLEYMLYKDLPEPDQRGGKNHMSLTVPSVERAIEILKLRPAYKHYGKELKMQVGRNRKRQVNLFDPDGTRVELMERNTIDGAVTPSSDAQPPRP